MAQTYIQQNSSEGYKIPYTNPTHKTSTIASSGCGCCSSLMVLLNSTSYSMTLKKWAKILMDKGARWGDGTDMIVVEKIMKNDYGFETSHTTDIEKLKAHIKAGYKAVANVGNKGYFSSAGHFVCIAGITKDGKAIVLDPSYYAGKWTTVCKGINRAKYFTYNSATHEVICDFSTIAADSRNYKYHLFKPTKKVRLVYSEKDIHKVKTETQVEKKPDKEVTTVSKKYFGVDISEHNGKVDWSKVAKKVDFAILRIGWVGNNENKMDTKFVENYKAAKKAGVKLGAYVYMYTKTTAKAKSGAEWILKQIKGYDFDLPIYCDMEDSTIAGLGKTTLTAITDAFNEAIKKGGYEVGIYANLDWFRNKLNTSVKKYHTWIAHYTSGTDKYKGEYEMWQNSSKGKVDGVSGNVDTNYLYENIFGKDATIQPVTPTPSKPATKTVTKYVNVKKSLNVRSDAKLAAKVVGSLNRGDKVTVYATKNGWSKISATENKWVSSAYLSNTKPATTKKVTYKTTVGKTYKLKKSTTLYDNSKMSGTKYQYKANTTVKVIKHITTTVDYVYIPANGKYRYCEVAAFV